MTRSRFLCGLLLMTFIGCSGAAAGCGGLTPLASRYDGPKNNNAMAVRLSPYGVNYINSNWQTLVDAFAPGRTLHIPIGCTTVNSNLGGGINLGNFAFADQGICSGGTCFGQLDGVCNTADLPADVIVLITGFALQPIPGSSSVQVVLTVAVDTGDVLIASQDQHSALCLGLSGIEARVHYATFASAPLDQRFNATIRFTVDQRWDQLLAFNVSSLTGVGICGASGVPPAPDCLQADDIAFSGANNCGRVYLSVLQINWLKTTLLQLLSGPLQTQVTTLLGNQSCQPCGAGLPACPTIDASTVSACVGGVCKDTGNQQCVPRFLGTEGRVSLGAALGSFGASPEAALDLSFALGHTATVDQGLTFGTRVGLRKVTQSSCVPAMPEPAMIESATPDFDGEAPAGSNYHVGMSLSSSFLNQAFFHIQQSGGLCLSLTTDNVALLSTDTVGLLLPSLKKLAARTERNDSGAFVSRQAPMLVSLRPQKPPVVTVGLGTVDPMTHMPIEPLLKLSLNELAIDLYVMLDDRYARLFTITADVTVPLGLTFEGCDTVTPALGDVSMLIANAHASNSEMLGEDPTMLVNLVEQFIGQAQPAIAKALAPIGLPALGSFKLKVNAVKGIGNIAGSHDYNHVGLFATLMPVGAACATAAPLTTANVLAVVPPVIAPHQAAVWPTVRLAVTSTGMPGTPEYAYQLDDGLWSMFQPAVGGELRVTQAALIAQGHHKLAIRSRMVEQPHGVSLPVIVDVLADFEAPDVTLMPDSDHNRLWVVAHDVVTAEDALQFAYALGDEAFSSFGSAREISLSAATAKGLRVEVRDAQGFVAKANWAAKVAAAPAGALAQVTVPAAGVGCSSVPAFALVGLLALTGLRRSSRRNRK